jgi:hypothetical protein
VNEVIIHSFVLQWKEVTQETMAKKKRKKERKKERMAAVRRKQSHLADSSLSTCPEKTQLRVKQKHK